MALEVDAHVKSVSNGTSTNKAKENESRGRIALRKLGEQRK